MEPKALDGYPRDPASWRFTARPGGSVIGILADIETPHATATTAPTSSAEKPTGPKPPEHPLRRRPGASRTPALTPAYG
jgi:hypothetical protein